MHKKTWGRVVLLAGLAWLSLSTARAEDIVVSNYGVSANGMPFAVAQAKGFFKAEGANVTGILTSAGGGTTLRNMLAGDAPYAEINPNAVIAAIQQGAKIKIVSDNVLTVAEFVWGVKPDSPIKTVADLKGRKLGYTNPRSTSQALATMILETAGLRTNDAVLTKTGGFGEGVAALDTGIIDATPIPEPLWTKFKGKYRAIATATDLLPPITNVVGVAATDLTPKQADFVRAVIRARRRAVAYMQDHPEESGSIIAKVYNLDPAVATEAMRNLVNSRTKGVPYWGPGDFYLDGLRTAIKVQKSVGAISGDVKAEDLIDTRYLPDDLKALK
ncbi:MAG TPA: ABC transporter substrate-binding protein [Rhodopila sp.]|nr:ABC transporter substrate-binding protein [Rhodopila sp.]